MTTVAPRPAAAAVPMTWAVLKRQIQEKQAAEAAALRRKIGPTKPLAPWELRSWIAKYEDWLTTTYVQERGALKDWAERQLAAAETELANHTTRSAR